MRMNEQMDEIGSFGARDSLKGKRASLCVQDRELL